MASSLSRCLPRHSTGGRCRRDRKRRLYRLLARRSERHSPKNPRRTPLHHCPRNCSQQIEVGSQIPPRSQTTPLSPFGATFGEALAQEPPSDSFAPLPTELQSTD